MGEKTGVMLAISLHAVTDELRDELVPLNKKYPIAELLDACRNWPGLSNAKRITFEYVMLKDVNDSDDDARALVKLLAGIPAKINLIPFNPWPGAAYECSTPERIRSFSNIIFEGGISAPVRTPRGSCARRRYLPAFLLQGSASLAPCPSMPHQHKRDTLHMHKPRHIQL